jgi:hypothetical protein
MIRECAPARVAVITQCAPATCVVIAPSQLAYRAATGSDANEAAIKSYNAAHGTAIAIRQVKYLNNVVEQDHRAVKRITRPMLGFKSFEAAQDTLVGIEFMHMIKKRQMVVKAGDEGLTAAELFYSLAA